MNGELESDGEGGWRLRFTRHLAHRPDDVWRALTDPSELSAWFPQRIEGDLLVPGSTLRFVSEPHPAFEGRVLRVVPPSLLEFSWGPDVLRFDVTGEGEGSTLVLTDTFTELGKAARDAAGWHTCLDLLQFALGAAVPSFRSEERWQAVHRGYVAAFGPDASTVGPPPPR